MNDLYVLKLWYPIFVGNKWVIGLGLGNVSLLKIACFKELEICVIFLPPGAFFVLHSVKVLLAMSRSFRVTEVKIRITILDQNLV